MGEHREVPGRRFERDTGADVRVLLADDHEATRAGVRLALDGGGFTIVAEVASASEAVTEAVRHRPDLCLLDVYMPGGGIAAARAITGRVPEAVTVMLTVSANPEDLFEAILAGATGYLLKNTSADRLPNALHGVLAGEAAVPRFLERGLIEELRDRELRRPDSRRFQSLRGGRSAALTAREWEVVELLRQRLSTTLIARRLGISEITVRRHISSVVHKLDAPNRAGALRLLGTDDPAGGRSEGDTG
jgi:DNA-binding NarL/FixJ family response regulator